MSFGISDDSHDTEQTLSRVAFGSCSKQWLAQPIWPMIWKIFQPQIWLWLGDAAYVGGEPQSNARDVHNALLAARSNGNYSSFARSVRTIEGTWDDHDFGLNDGGYEVPEKDIRQKAFLEFLGVGKNSTRYNRKGVYSSHRFGQGKEEVQIIFLDTRTHLDPPFIPYLMESNHFPWPLVNAFSRLCTVALGIPGASQYNGDVLGEDQWRWLEGLLVNGPVPTATVVVSSIQVLTSNPIVEGWGHYPEARRRLLDLLGKHRPKGSLILSGDVHFAELSGTFNARVDGSTTMSAPLEITSSGLTHTCHDLAGSICERVLSFFSEHRPHPDDFYAGLNFGALQFKWHAANGPEVEVRIYDAHENVVLSTIYALNKSSFGPAEYPGFAFGFARKFCLTLLLVPMVARLAYQTAFRK